MVRKPLPASSYALSKVVGGALIGVVIAWLVWTLFFSRPETVAPVQWLFPGVAPVTSLDERYPALRDAGISLRTTDQKPTLSREQALLLAQQADPEAAEAAAAVEAVSGVLTYTGAQDALALRDSPVWMVVYQKVPTQAGETSVDPSSLPSGGQHDLYLFFDASSGQMVLSIWS